MNNVRLLSQRAAAYSQAPWRKQVQMLVFFLLVLVMLALIAGIYLNVSANTVAAGVEIQTIESEKEETKLAIQDLETQLAFLTSSSAMEERARAMGLEKVEPGQIEYIEVPGYPGRQGPSLAPPPQPQVIAAPGLSPEFEAQFTETIVEWFVTNILVPSGVMDAIR